MRNGKKTGKKINIAIVVLLMLVLSLSPFKMLRAGAAGNVKITSMDDFYVKLSNQIFAHEVDAMYDITDYGLVKSIMDLDMEDYQYHYDEQHPLISGCYLSYYINYLSLYYANGRLRIVIQFKYSKKDMDEHFSMMKELAAELKCSKPYDTVQNVHDYLIKKFEYDTKTLYVNHTDIDGFKDDQMVCSGYSLAAYYLLNEAGVPARVITGYGGDGSEPETSNHMWNMVELDGKWYNMDITWDDTNGRKPTYKYFLKSDKDFPMHKRLGNYEISFFDYSVADKSYKLPVKLRLGNISWYAFFMALIIAGMIISSRIISKKNNQRINKMTYIVDDQTDYLTKNETEK